MIKLKSYFARHGIPVTVVVSNIATYYTSSIFSKNWDFYHVVTGLK